MRCLGRSLGAMKSRYRMAIGGVAAWTALCCATGIASALPAGRAYEMVSPVFKGGFGAPGVEAVAPDGESVMFYSPGAFAGAPAGPHVLDYFAHRGSTGWSTSPSMPPASLIGGLETVDVSPSLEDVLAIGKPGESFEGTLPLEDVLLHPTSLPDGVHGWERGGAGEAAMPAAH